MCYLSIVDKTKYNYRISRKRIVIVDVSKNTDQGITEKWREQHTLASIENHLMKKVRTR